MKDLSLLKENKYIQISTSNNMRQHNITVIHNMNVWGDVTYTIYMLRTCLTLYVAVTQFTYGKLRYCYVKS